MQTPHSTFVRQSAFAMCLLFATVAAGVVGNDGPPTRRSRSAQSVADYRKIDSRTPASHARRKLVLLASLDGRFSQPEAAVAGVMQEWLEIRNYKFAQEFLKDVPVKRMLAWTSSGFDLDGFKSFWIVDTGRRQLVVWANYDTLIVTSLTTKEAKSLEPLWTDFSTRIGKSHIEEPEKVMILGGAVGVMTFKDSKGERFLFCYGLRESPKRKWSHIFKHARAVAKVVSHRTRTSIEPFIK